MNRCFSRCYRVLATPKLYIEMNFFKVHDLFSIHHIFPFKGPISKKTLIKLNLPKKCVVQSCSITKCSLYLQKLTWHLKKEPWHTRFLLQTYHFWDLLMNFFSGVYQWTWKMDSNVGLRKKKTWLSDWLSIDKNGFIPSRKLNTSPLKMLQKLTPFLPRVGLPSFRGQSFPLPVFSHVF